MNPYVHTIQNMYDKGGERVSKAELWPLKVDPYFEPKKKPKKVFRKTFRPQFSRLSLAIESAVF